MIYSVMAVSLVGAEFTFVKTLKEVATKLDIEVVNIEFEFENKTDEIITIIAC